MSFASGRVWTEVQIEPKPEPEPELTRANHPHWPPLYLPSQWPPERREAVAQRFQAS